MKKSRGLTARLKSFTYAFAGFKTLLKEPNFGIHLVAMTSVIILATFLKVNRYDWLFLIIAMASVIFAEAINTSLEYLVDLASPQYHELAKNCKDVAAFAVLLSASCALLIGLFIFIPYLT